MKFNHYRFEIYKISLHLPDFFISDVLCLDTGILNMLYPGKNKVQMISQKEPAKERAEDRRRIKDLPLPEWGGGWGEGLAEELLRKI